MSIKFDVSGIDFSWADKRKGIILPTELTPKLAEIIGIHIGDGSLYLSSISRKRSL